MWGFAPVLTRLGRDMGFVPFVIGACTVLFLLTLVIAPQGRSSGILNLLSPNYGGLVLFGASGSYPVFVYGRWWTVLTAGWLHANLIHILLNMLSVRNVAPIVGEFYGASRMIIIYVVSGVAGFTLSTIGGTYLRFIPFLGGGGFTVGASASISGLIGALLLYGHRTGSSAVSEQAKMWILSFLLMGFVFSGIDNWAHLGGLAGGYACAKFLDPMYPERLDHFLIALACFVITAIAFVASILHGISLLG
jgi:rhomboid protease GluP